MSAANFQASLDFIWGPGRDGSRMDSSPGEPFLTVKGVIQTTWDSAVRAGIFPPIGSGSVDVRGFLDDLKASGYQGWIVVEQDTLDERDAKGRTPLEAVGISRDFLRKTLGI